MSVTHVKSRGNLKGTKGTYIYVYEEGRNRPVAVDMIRAEPEDTDNA